MKKIVIIGIFACLIMAMLPISNTVQADDYPTQNQVINVGEIFLDSTPGSGHQPFFDIDPSNHYDINVSHHGTITVIADYDLTMSGIWNTCKARIELVGNEGIYYDETEEFDGSGHWTDSLSFSFECQNDASFQIRLKGDYVPDPFQDIGEEHPSELSYCSTLEWEVPENHAPNDPAKPSGDTDVKISKYGYHWEHGTSEQRSYTTSATDSNGDDVRILIDFGNGDNSGWRGPVCSGCSVSASVTWSSPDTYSVKAKAEDIPQYDDQEQKESGWSEDLEVSVYFWYMDFSAYSEAVAVNISVLTYESVVEPFIPEPTQSLINVSNLCYQGFFLDSNNDSVYDQVFIVRFTDSEHVFQEPTLYSVFYDARDETYIVDFNENNVLDAEESSTYAEESSLESCVDGDPLEAVYQNLL